jgi:hypothetical protein
MLRVGSLPGTGPWLKCQWLSAIVEPASPRANARLAGPQGFHTPTCSSSSSNFAFFRISATAV